MNNKYSSLDGLRAFAAIWIVMMHVLSNTGISLSVSGLNGIINSGTNCTFLFMMLSAFGMCCGYYERFKQKQIDLDLFYKKRYIRIVPFFALLVFIDLIMKPSLTELYEGFTDLTLAFGLLPNAGITVIGVGWFLGVVFVFYMIFPFFVFLLDNKRRAWFVLIVSILLHFLAISYYSRSELMVVSVGKWNIVYSFPFFVVGGLIYLHRQFLIKILCYTKWLAPMLLCFVVLGYYILPKIQLFSELLFFSVFVMFAISRLDKKGVLNNLVAKFISEISMEVYLCHMLFFRVVEMLHLDKCISNHDLLFIVMFFLTLSGAIIFSLIWKRIIEVKLINIICKKESRCE